MSQEGKPDIAYWAGTGGAHWARHNDFTERLFRPVTALLLAAINIKPGERVVDIGCGCGGLALALAKQGGPMGFVLGLDVSTAMLALARRLAPSGTKVEFIEADATTFAFDRHDFDLMVSRHGVMFFADPVRAFANLRTALKPSARLVFSCFRAPRDNPWAMVPVEAAYQVVPRLPKPAPEDPGAFAFAEPARVERILSGAGFTQVTFTPHDVAFDLAAGGGLEVAVKNMLEIGPVSRTFDPADTTTRDKVGAALRTALAPFVNGPSVPLGAAIWLVTARNP